MANKKSNKKKASVNADPKAAASKDQSKKVDSKKKAPSTKSPKKAEKKPGFIARTKAYMASVRSEMKRVVWPTKKELVNYTVAVCASLLVVGVVIALLDIVISEGLVLFASLRG